MPPARPTFPSILAPQLCVSAKEPPAGDGWVHEIKYDGWRLLARRDAQGVRLFTRGGHDWTARLPAIAGAIEALPLRRTWLDGELVVLDSDGLPDFEALPTAMRTPGQPRLLYHVWDTPWWNGREVASAPLLERKALVARLAGMEDQVRYTAHLVGDAREIMAHVDAMDLEGIVSKHTASRYRPGSRTSDWRKVKCWRTGTFVVGGIARDAEGRVEALLVGTPEAGGLRYEGRVELGLQAMRGRWRELHALACTECPFGGRWSGKGRSWVRPQLVVRLKSLPRRSGRALRHAVLTG